MCAINPRFKKRIIFDFYTSHLKITKEEFDNECIKWSCSQELLINSLAPSIRVHCKETKQKAD